MTIATNLTASAGEARRIAAVRVTGLLDTPPEERFDRITRIARDLFKMPIALVSLVDVDRQWFKSRIGTDLTETPRADALCGHAVLADGPLIVRDATIDPRFMDNPLVTGAMHLRFYAGIPLRGPDGQRVGTLCVIDYVPRDFDDRQIQALQDLSLWATLEINASSLGQAAALAQEKEARLNAVVEYAGDGIVTLDDARRIESMNPAAARMFDYIPLQVLGEPIDCLLADDCRTQLEADFNALAAAGRNRGVGIERRVSGRRDDGSYFSAELVLSKMWLNDRFGYTCIVRDLTERQKIDAMKSEFISTVSHELRTPLTSIRGSLGLMVGGAVGEMPARAKPLLEIANKNCERLVRLINDILDIEKIESGNMRFQLVTQRLMPLVEQAIAATQAYALQFNVRLELLRDTIDGYVDADADRITQVLVNLLSNAIKFSRAGATVEVRLVRLPHAMRLSVTNYGEGISDEFRNRIFQKFAQADSSDTRAKGGTGLGLSICKLIIEKHLGRVDFSSEPGVLTEFFFELPHAMAPLDCPSLAGQILICDADGERANALGIALVRHGITGDIAADGNGVRRLLDRSDYAVLILVQPASEPGTAMSIGQLNAAIAAAPDGLAHSSARPTRRLPMVVIGEQTDSTGSAFAQSQHDPVRLIANLIAPVDEPVLLAVLRNAIREWLHAVPRILYLERDPDLAQVVTAFLDPEFSICHAASLASARRCLREERFDVILTDLQLSDGPSSLLLAELSPLNRETPIVVFSDDAAGMPAHVSVRATLIKSQTSRPQMIAALRRLTAPAPETGSTTTQAAFCDGGCG